MADQKNTDTSAELAGLACLAVLGGLIYLCFMGWQAMQKYGWTSHDVLISVQYHNWVVGEYKNCTTLNTPTPNENLLDCSDAQGRDIRVFRVLFYGGTYDKEKPKTFVHNWKCRKREDSPAFVCSLPETPASVQSPESTPEAQPQSTPQPERPLPDEYIENLRQRDACERRFYDKKISEVDGMSIGAACNENPDRKP